MTRILFDDKLRRIRHHRALGLGGDNFLRQRAFDECLDRLTDIRRRFDTALIVGRHVDGWRDAIATVAGDVRTVTDPLFDPASLEPQSVDLCLAIGALETINDLPAATLALRYSLRPGGLLVGAIVGGSSLPRLRAAMLAADRLDGRAVSRIHPMIDGPSLAALLTSVGLVDPVIDVERVDVAYPDLDRLVVDLRAMGCTNVLANQSPAPLTRRTRTVARQTFLDGRPRAIERFELLYFTAWSPET